MMVLVNDELPPLDLHEVGIPASVSEVWAALVATIVAELSRPSARLVAKITGVRHDPADPGFPLTGTEVAGFRVALSAPNKRLRLEGHHRFSRYALDFELTGSSGATRLSAATYASFPGRVGGLYRMFLLGTRGHRLVVKHLLRAVRRRAGTAATTPLGRSGERQRGR